MGLDQDQGIPGAKENRLPKGAVGPQALRIRAGSLSHPFRVLLETEAIVLDYPQDSR